MRLRWLIWIMALFVLSACSQSFEEELKETTEAVEAVFDSEPNEATDDNHEIQFHLPAGFEVEEESPNNILLSSGSTAYILFYNPFEDRSSKVVYESTMNQYSEWDAQYTFVNDHEFGYLLVKKMETGEYQVVAGVGGVKVTAETKNLKSDAATMMRMAKSVKKK